jgi:hypothetical protein
VTSVLLTEVPLDRIGSVTHSFHCFFELRARNTKALRPVRNLVVLRKADSASVGLTAIRCRIGHDLLHSQRLFAVTRSLSAARLISSNHRRRRRATFIRHLATGAVLTDVRKEQKSPGGSFERSEPGGRL